MELPKRVDYAIRGIHCLAQAGRPLYVHEISRMESVPQASLAKIFQVLVRRGLLASIRGRWGGYALALPPEEITLARIFEAVEGNLIPERCPFVDTRCPRRRHCLFFDIWRQAASQMFRALESVSLRDLLAGEKNSTGSGSDLLPNSFAGQQRAQPDPEPRMKDEG